MNRRMNVNLHEWGKLLEEEPQYGPLTAWREDLNPSVEEALLRGATEYGAMWLEHMAGDSCLADVRHTIEVHAMCRIHEAVERLDYGDTDGFIAKLGSAVGYLANAICKARCHQVVGEPEEVGDE